VLPALREVLNPMMRRLAAQTRETVSCAIRDGSSWVILEQVLDISHVVHVREEIGTRFPLHLGAHGHALMSTLDPDALAAYYARTPVPDRIKAEIDSAKTRGYALSRSELRVGVLGVAACGMFHAEGMPFSLAVILPIAREADIPSHLAPLLDAVSSISAAIR
jgi:DNA-binding IclR family transcriptional regulator